MFENYFIKKDLFIFFLRSKNIQTKKTIQFGANLFKKTKFQF